MGKRMNQVRNTFLKADKCTPGFSLAAWLATLEPDAIILRKKPHTVPLDEKDMEKLLTAVARAGTREAGKDPEVNAEKWLRMDKNGQ